MLIRNGNEIMLAMKIMDEGEDSTFDGMDLDVNIGRLNLPCAPPFYEKNSKVLYFLRSSFKPTSFCIYRSRCINCSIGGTFKKIYNQA